MNFGIKLSLDDVAVGIEIFDGEHVVVGVNNNEMLIDEPFCLIKFAYGKLIPVIRIEILSCAYFDQVDINIRGATGFRAKHNMLHSIEPGTVYQNLVPQDCFSAIRSAIDLGRCSKLEGVEFIKSIPPHIISTTYSVFELFVNIRFNFFESEI